TRADGPHGRRPDDRDAPRRGARAEHDVRLPRPCRGLRRRGRRRALQVRSSGRRHAAERNLARPVHHERARDRERQHDRGRHGRARRRLGRRARPGRREDRLRGPRLSRRPLRAPANARTRPRLDARPIPRAGHVGPHRARWGPASAARPVRCGARPRRPDRAGDAGRRGLAPGGAGPRRFHPRRQSPAGVSSDDTRPGRLPVRGDPRGTASMSALVRLYPAAWRDRYGEEFKILLEERPPSKRDVLDIVVSALDARVSPQVAGAVRIPTPWSSRLSGASAILGGLLWCVVIVLLANNRSEQDYTLPILMALGLMLLSLPGRYMRRYAKPIVVGVSAAGL